MISIGKAAFIASLVVSVSSSVAITSVRTSRWYSNHPEAQEWIKKNNYSVKADGKFIEFVNNSSSNNFALGCHKIIFEGKGFKQLYTDADIDTQANPQGSQPETKLTEPVPFDNGNEPVLGFSTAHRKVNNVYEFELALRQGDKGLVERISVHTNKIISQLVFFERDRESETEKYKHTFGLYKYIKQDHQSTDSKKTKTYKVANPKNEEDIWKELTDLIGANEPSSRYYAVWIESNKVTDEMFDSIGIKSKEKIFSSLVDSEHEGSSNFIYVTSIDTNGDLQQTLTSSSPKRHNLSVLNNLRNQLKKRKGKWKQVDSFCKSAKDITSRLHIKEMKQLSKYCYSKTQTKAQ